MKAPMRLLPISLGLCALASCETLTGVAPKETPRVECEVAIELDESFLSDLAGVDMSSELITSIKEVVREEANLGLRFYPTLSESYPPNDQRPPHLMTIDNQPATISVGSNIPYKSSAGGAPSPLGGAVPPNIERMKIALTLAITPHVSTDDTVRLDIKLDSLQLGKEDFGDDLGPTWKERSIETSVILRDQESLVLGGLVDERIVESVSGVPIAQPTTADPSAETPEALLPIGRPGSPPRPTIPPLDVQTKASLPAAELAWPTTVDPSAEAAKA